MLFMNVATRVDHEAGQLSNSNFEPMTSAPCSSRVWAWFAARARVSLGSTPLLARAPGDDGRSSREPKLLKQCYAARARSPGYLKGSGELATPRSSFSGPPSSVSPRLEATCSLKAWSDVCGESLRYPEIRSSRVAPRGIQRALRWARSRCCTRALRSGPRPFS